MVTHRSRALLLTLLVVLLLPGVGHAVPGQLTDQLDQARDRLAELDARASQAVEEYNLATAQLAQLEAEQSQTRQRVEALADRVAELEEVTAGYVRSMYMRGPTNGVTAMLDATELADVGRGVAMVDRLARQRHVQVEQLARRRTELTAARAALAKQVEQAEQRADVVAQRRDDVEALLADQRDEVQQLQQRIERIEQREAEEAARRAREAAERRAQQAPQGEPAEQDQASTASRPAPEHEPDPEPEAAPEPAPAGTRSGADVAVDAAMSQRGDPYRWGGSGPDSYDCSGLMMWSWRHAGVSLPHSSRMQYSATTRISRGQLQPGDLVFFGSPIHHVAMYIGGGRVVEAPSSGKVVRVNSSALSRGDIAGYGRV